MTDEAWAKGMAEMAASFPDKDEDPRVKAIRGQVYRRELGKLTDQSWLYAVREAIRNEKWFPTVSTLLDYANDAPEPEPVALLPEDTRSVEEKRAEVIAGLEKIKAVLEGRLDVEKLAESKAMPGLRLDADRA